MHRNTVVALLAGLAGGMLTRYIAPPPVFAQNPTLVPKEIRAESFTFVDSSDRPAGTLTVEKGPNRIGSSQIVLRDPRGRVIWSAGGSGFLPLSER